MTGLNIDQGDQGDIVAIGGGTELVRIHPDGTLTYGADYTPDEAARAFWEALALWPSTHGLGL